MARDHTVKELGLSRLKKTQVVEVRMSLNTSFLLQRGKE